MKHIIPLFLIVFMGSSPFAMMSQSFKGVATYQSATTLDVKMDSTKVAQSQQEAMMQMLNKQLQKEYELTFDKATSLWKEVEKLEEGFNMMGMASMLTGTAGVLFKNIQEMDYMEEQEFFGKVFLIKDTLQKLDWKLGKESKKIGNYNCFKATAEVESISKTFKDMADEEEMEKIDTSTTEIVAWYTPQIPVAHGPDEYWGLPGLILEVKKGKTTLLCTKVVMNPEESMEIEAPEKGEVVSREEYEETVKDKIEQMKEIYGGSHRKGSGTSIRIETN